MPDALSQQRTVFLKRIYPVPLKPASKINTWEGWPDDVRDIIRDWNKRCGLSFLRGPVFKCEDCEAFCEPHKHGVATFRRTTTLCDDCLIERARAGYKPAPRIQISLDDVRWRGGGVMHRRAA